jgi:hypothetical protein
MRVNLYEKAKQQNLAVNTAKVAVDGAEGLRFQFTPRPVATVEFPKGRIASGRQRHPRDATRGFGEPVRSLRGRIPGASR